MAENETQPAEREEKKGDIFFRRQLPLLKEILVVQDRCYHTLVIGKNLILCNECGALWLK